MQPRFIIQPNLFVKTALAMFCSLALILAISLPSFAQTNTDEESTSAPKSDQKKKKSEGPGGDVKQGGKDIGKGAAKGAVDLGTGAAGGAVDLATGHPIDAAVSVGKGAAGAGTHLGVGAAKGTYKIGKGIGGLFKKLGRKSDK